MEGRDEGCGEERRGGEGRGGEMRQCFYRKFAVGGGGGQNGFGGAK